MPYGTILTDVIQSSTAGTPPQFNDGNSVQTGTLCRAWVNFNGVTSVTINSSFNVSSVTRSGSGQYYVNFTNALSSTGYSFVGSASVSSGNFGIVMGDESASRTTLRTGLFYTANAASVNSAADANNINVAVFR